MVSPITSLELGEAEQTSDQPGVRCKGKKRSLDWREKPPL